MLGSVPVFGSFFLFYAPLRSQLQANGYDAWIPVASAACAAPATILGVLADVLKKRLVGLDQDDINSCLVVIGWLTSSSESIADQVLEGENLADIQERKYREQFPDHRKEFTEMFQENDEDTSENSPVEQEAKENDEAPSFSDSQLELICLLLHDIFVVCC